MYKIENNNYFMTIHWKCQKNKLFGIYSIRIDIEHVSFGLCTWKMTDDIYVSHRIWTCCKYDGRKILSHCSRVMNQTCRIKFTSFIGHFGHVAESPYSVKPTIWRTRFNSAINKNDISNLEIFFDESNIYVKIIHFFLILFQMNDSKYNI